MLKISHTKNIMKLHKLHSLRSNFNIPVTFSNKKVGVGCTRFLSKLEQMTKTSEYKPENKPKRIAYVRKFKEGYHAVGMGIITGDFAAVKQALKNAGFTGFRMGAIKAKLS